jgi:hypothetical protein
MTPHGQDAPQWESVNSGVLDVVVRDTTHRLKVPGGWLYRNVLRFGAKPLVAMTFVPQPPQGPLERVQ